MKYIKKYGSAQAFLKCSPEFLQHFEITTESSLKGFKYNGVSKIFENGSQQFIFETHKDLDRFVCHLLKKEPEIATKYSDVWTLLKGFDRSFWLRYLYQIQKDSLVSIEEKKMHFASPLGDDDGISICPFGDPSEISFNNIS